MQEPIQSDGEALLTHLDPVIGAAVFHRDIETRLRDIEEKQAEAHRSGDTTAEIYYASAAKHAYDEALAARAAIPHRKAKSLLGAAVHLSTALRILDLLQDELPDPLTFNARRYHREIIKCLFSALDAVEKNSRAKLEDVIHPDWCGRHQDPWVPVEDRLAAIERSAS